MKFLKLLSPGHNAAGNLSPRFYMIKSISKLVFGMAAFVSCNQVKEVNPQRVTVPDRVIQLIENNYENPKNLVFSEVIKDRVWNVDLESASKKYNAAVNPDNIIVSYRLAGEPVPDSLKNLLNPSSIAGGIFSNFKEQEYSWVREGNYGRWLLADYEWNNESYLFRWGVTYLSGKNTYNLEMRPVKSEVTTQEIQDIPQSIRDYIAGKSLQFSNATITTTNDGKLIYNLNVRSGNTYFQLIFNNDLTLVAGGDQLTSLSGLIDLPVSIQNYLAQPRYQGFGFTGQFAGIQKREYDGVVSYHVGTQKHNGTMYGSQAWFIVFDSNGNPITRSYLGLY
jgi:hypothetical protein